MTRRYRQPDDRRWLIVPAATLLEQRSARARRRALAWSIAGALVWFAAGAAAALAWCERHP